MHMRYEAQKIRATAQPKALPQQSHDKVHVLFCVILYSIYSYIHTYVDTFICILTSSDLLNLNLGAELLLCHQS